MALDVVLLVGIPRGILVGVGEELRCLLQVQVPGVAELRQDELFCLAKILPHFN